MPRGPKGEKRPADVIGNAVHVMRIATGDATEDGELRPDITYASKGGKKGGPARAKALTPQRRREIAKRAAQRRWGDKRKDGP